MKSVFRLRFLGSVQIERDGESVHGFESRKALALLAYLVVEGQPVPRERLVDLFWEDKTEAQGRNNLNWVLNRLSTFLPGCLQADRHTVQFLGEGTECTYWLDLDTFEELEAQDNPASLAEAVELYRGEFLEGLVLRGCPEFELWQVREQERWRRRVTGALNQLVAHHGRQGEVEQGLRFARRLLRLEPWREEAHREVMRLLALDGQRSAALTQYETCRRTLAEELGVEPSEATELLYTQIQVGELALPAPVPRVEVPVQRPAFLEEAAEREDAEGPVFVARERELARLDGYLEAALAGQGQVAFVIGGPGRGKTALMREFARQAMKVHSDLLVAHGNCNAYSGVGDPYLPFRELLGMLTGDVEGRWAAGTVSHDHALRLWAALPLALRALVDHGPSLIGSVVSGAPLLSRAAAVAPESTEGDAAWLRELRVLAERERPGHGGLEQSAIFQQVTNVLRALAQAHPLLLVLDDVQWADAGSIGLLFHLGRRLEGGRILITCAYRPEEVALERGGSSTDSRRRQRHLLDKVLAEFRRSFGDVWVDLRRVDETQGRSFVDGFLDTEPNRLGEDFRNELFLRTGGHPLFTVELLRAMQERDDLIQDAEGRWVQGPALDWESLPARVEAVIKARLGRLDEQLREVLAVASVEGEQFTAQVVAQVQGIPEREILRMLFRELGGRHRLVREGGEAQVGGRFLSHYQFAHALFQEYVYRRLSGGERRLLHGEVAMALEALYGSQTDEIVAPLAHHYVEAGQTEKAIECSLRAGEQARLTYANEEAIAYLHRALQLLDESPLGESRKDWRVEALGGLGQIYLEIGKIAEAKEPLREAIALGQEIGLSPRELVRLYRWLGEVLWWQGRFDDQIRVGEEGLTLLGDATESVEAALMNNVIAMGYFWTGNLAGFRELTHRTAQFIQRLPYSGELGSAYSGIIGACFEVDKNVEEGMKWFQALEEMATQHHDLRAWLGAHLDAGDFLAEVGDLHGAVSRCQQGLELSARIGDCKSEGRSLMHMAQAF